MDRQFWGSYFLVLRLICVPLLIWLLRTPFISFPVKDMFLQEGSWNVDLILPYLPHHILQDVIQTDFSIPILKIAYMEAFTKGDITIKS